MLLAGIFVGGRASRMGGVAKGMLIAPDGEPIIVRTLRLLDEVGVPDRVLVGKHPGYDNNASLAAIRVLDDDARAQGPLAGLLALMEHARERGASAAIAIACDMPLLTHDVLRRLIDAPAAAPIVAPRHGAFWEPLIARYAVSSLELVTSFALAPEATGRGRKLQHLLDLAGAHPLALTPAEEALLVDWDTPEDVSRTRVHDA